jgi:hypothetical protein
VIRSAFSANGRRLFAAVGLVFAFATSPFARAQLSAPVSFWTTKDGHYFQAQFLRLHGTSVVFARDGLELTVSIFSLSASSLELARRQAMRAPADIRAMSAARAILVKPLAPIASFSFAPSILAFCQDSIGKKIGTGQCAALAAEALKNAGAPARGSDWPGEGDYVWGEPVAWVKAGFYGAKGVRELAHVQAGDIVQFHNARFAGYNHSNSGVYRMEARHHTAIVESVDSGRQTITVLHQNWNGQKVVRRQTLYLGGMTGGWLRFYHPVSPLQVSSDITRPSAPGIGG